MAVKDTKHTPGPWYACDTNEGTGLPPSWSVVNDEFLNPTDEDKPFLEVNIANGSTADAHLIAAAPEMYAALEALHTLIDFDEPLLPGDLGIDDPTYANEAITKARAALRKARGEA